MLVLKVHGSGTLACIPPTFQRWSTNPEIVMNRFSHRPYSVRLPLLPVQQASSQVGLLPSSPW
jgi:hypothetical protein